MSDTITFTSSKKPIELTIDVPHGFADQGRLIPTLGYPWETVAFADWAVPQTLPPGDGDAYHDAMPRVDLMPVERALLWIILGDWKADLEAEPNTSSPLESGGYEYFAPWDLPESSKSPGVMRGPVELGSEDSSGMWWDRVSVWNRVVPLADADGIRQSYPTYLQLFGFVASGGDKLAIDSLVGSLKYRYV